MTQLQKIVAKAKILKKSHPNTKWTDLIKKASKLVTPKSKSVGAVKKKKHALVKPLAKKKKTVKRSTSRSAESEKVRAKVKKDGFIMPHGYQVTKGKRIVAGIGTDAINRIKNIQQRILSSETMANNLKSLMKSDKYKKDKEFIKEAKNTIMTITKVNRDYKKMITSLKKHIK
jgi:hypothetical protein